MNNPPPWIWKNGSWTRWQDATVHISAHALHYGSSVFEGIRAYETENGTAVFRLREHLRRLLDSARLLRFDLAPYPLSALEEASVEIIRRNRLGACYLRPLVFRDAGGLRVDGRACPVTVAILAFEWGAYLGPEALEHGVDAGVSSWRRFSSGSMAPMGKIGGQYVNNQFVSAEAQTHGYAEGILLDQAGLVSEGGGENLFLVRDDTIFTPPFQNSILAGITRDTVLTLAADLGMVVKEQSLNREMLYLADEIFLTGTAAEITPVRSVDRIPVGEGTRGPITRRLQEAFFDVVSGRAEDRHHWLTPVPSPALELVAT